MFSDISFLVNESRSQTESPEKTTPSDALFAEWSRLINETAKEARSLPAKALVLALKTPENWAPTFERAKQLQAASQEMSVLLDREALWGVLHSLEDPTLLFEQLDRGAVLSLEDLRVIRSWLYACDSWVQVPMEEVRGEMFRRALATLVDPTVHVRLLDRIMTPEGELSERASPKLASLLSEIRQLKREIEQRLDELLKTYDKQGLIQEQFRDVRDGRYVVPVKTSRQNEIEGILHEASVSKQTVFIEPKEITQLNNRLRQRQNELAEETLRILEETSKALRPHVEELRTNCAVMIEWDHVQAKARIARQYGGKSLQIVPERKISLAQTAHPLLWWSLRPEFIIRNDIELSDPVRALLITGPNTGGKTVLLKAIAFAVFASRTGFFIPATMTPIVGFFDTVFSDVGDPQSLENSLSSFSGHILRFKTTLDALTSQSLVLIDEMNSATDPEEGAALARAFIETLLEKGAMVVVTTHDPTLKALAYSDNRILNASMAFDENAKTPSYRLVLGVPGRSRALETAERLGLPASVLALARQYLSTEHKHTEELLARMQREADEAERARKEAYQLRAEADQLKKDWLERTEKLVGDSLDRTKSRLKRIVEEAQEQVRLTLKKLDEMRTRKSVDEIRENINEQLRDSTKLSEEALTIEAPEIAEALKHSPARTDQSALPNETKNEFKIGMRVRVPRWKTIGEIVSIKGNELKVAMGSLNVTLTRGDIEPLTLAQTQQLGLAPHTSKKSSRMVLVDRPAPPSRQIDLRGKRLDDAMSELEGYLDLAYRSGALAEVTIVHGLGTGAIREGTRSLLKSLPYIKTIRDGGLGAGGTGATIVEFDLE